MIRVTVWNEFYHERHNQSVREIYPDGIHGKIADFLSADGGMLCRTATLDEPEHGLSVEVLEQTDVLVYWAHCRHAFFEDEIAARVQQYVLRGMGLVLLHSGHGSKLFKRLMGTNCGLAWSLDGDLSCRVCVIDQAHPITQGIPQYFWIDKDEMYGEPFAIPQPDQQILITWYPGGEVFRSGCCWHRGKGRIFYFSAGHEEFPVFDNEYVQKIIINGVKWASHTR
jgi:trehalose utilization protein